MEFINLNESDKRPHMVKSKKQLEDNPDDDAHMPSFLDHYVNRHDALEGWSLFQTFVNMTHSGKSAPPREYDDTILTQPTDDDGFLSSYGLDTKHPDSIFFQLRSGLCFPHRRGDGHFASRKRLKWPRTWFPDLLNSEKNREDFYRRLCLLFIPFRAELTSANSTSPHFFEEFYEDWLQAQPEAKQNSIACYIDRVLSRLEWIRLGIEEGKKRRAEAMEAMEAQQDQEELEPLDVFIPQDPEPQEIQLNAGILKILNLISHSGLF